MPIPPLVNGRPKYPAYYQIAELPAMWKTSAFKISFGPVTGWSFLGKQFTLTITNFDGTRRQFTETDFVLSDNNTVARLTKNAAWVAVNMPVGWWEGHFHVNGVEDHWAPFSFELVEPIGGAITR